MYRYIIMRSLLFLAFSSFGTVFGSSAYGGGNENFAIYYSDKAPIERFNHYKLLVLDRIHHPSLQELSEDSKLLLGYISLGEIKQTDPYYDALKQNHLVLQENKNWKGSYVIDLRNPLWQKIVIEEIIPDVLRQGFNGVFFDTLDSPLELENSNPEKYKGMNDAAVHIIQAVRENYPLLKIMVNRSYAILPRIVFDINMVLGESVAGEYDFAKRNYIRVKPALYQQQIQWLQEAKRKDPGLQVYTLDYADTRDNKAVAEIYRLQRANGFIPYVTSVGLDELGDGKNLVDNHEITKKLVLQ